MCLITSDSKPKVAENDITVFKKLVIQCRKTGIRYISTPFMDVRIGKLPYLIEAAWPLIKGEGLSVIHPNNSYPKWKNEWKGLKLYSCDCQAVHAYVDSINNKLRSFAGDIDFNDAPSSFLIINVEATCIIPKGTLYYTCFKPYYDIDHSIYEIAAEKLIVEKIEKPLEDNFDDEIWYEIDKYIIPEINRINKGEKY